MGSKVGELEDGLNQKLFPSFGLPVNERIDSETSPSPAAPPLDNFDASLGSRAEEGARRYRLSSTIVMLVIG